MSKRSYPINSSSISEFCWMQHPDQQSLIAVFFTHYEYTALFQYNEMFTPFLSKAKDSLKIISIKWST